MHMKLKLTVINVVVLITEPPTVQYDEILRVTEQNLFSINYQKTYYEAQMSPTQTCKEKSVEKTKHMK